MARAVQLGLQVTVGAAQIEWPTLLWKALARDQTALQNNEDAGELMRVE